MARNTLDLLFQVLHLLYGYRQSVDKEQSKSTRGHRTSEKKSFQSLFAFSDSEQHGHPYIFISFLQGAPERRCSSRTFRYGYLVTT